MRPPLSAIDWKKCGGLVPAITQDCESGEVLMLAYMDQRAFGKTWETKRAHYFSRSKKRLWLKGEKSGHEQIVEQILIDCDRDAVLLKVRQVGGAACHKGYRSCFYCELDDYQPALFDWPGLTVVGKRVFDPEKVYKKGE